MSLGLASCMFSHCIFTVQISAQNLTMKRLRGHEIKVIELGL
jgi:hypothetical protein